MRYVDDEKLPQHPLDLSLSTILSSIENILTEMYIFFFHFSKPNDHYCYNVVSSVQELKTGCYFSYKIRQHSHNSRKM